MLSASFPFVDCLSVFLDCLSSAFFVSTRSLFVVWSSLLCGIAYVSKLIRQKWEHCTLPECQARASRQVSWQPDHVLITCFRKNVHRHHKLLRSGRRQTQKLAATVSNNAPLRASAALVGRKPTLLPCDQTTDKEHRQARRRFLHSNYLARLLRVTAHWLGNNDLPRKLLSTRNSYAISSCFTLSARRMLHGYHSEP